MTTVLIADRVSRVKNIHETFHLGHLSSDLAFIFKSPELVTSKEENRFISPSSVSPGVVCSLHFLQHAAREEECSYPVSAGGGQKEWLPTAEPKCMFKQAHRGEGVTDRRHGDETGKPSFYTGHFSSETKN